MIDYKEVMLALNLTYIRTLLSLPESIDISKVEMNTLSTFGQDGLNLLSEYVNLYIKVYGKNTPK